MTLNRLVEAAVADFERLDENKVSCSGGGGGIKEIGQ